MAAGHGLHSHAAGGVSRPTWKPLYFHPIYILSVAVLHILHIVGIQLLIKRRDYDEPEISLVQHNVTVTNPKSMFILREDDVGAFMAWTYLPVAIVTIIGVLWEALDVTARRLEPFHQLASSKGGNVSNALCLDYVGMFGFAVPFSAIRKGHHTVAMASTVFIVAAIILPAITGGIFTIEWGSLSFAMGKTDGIKLATVSINTGLAITTQAIHGLVAAMGVAVAIMLLFRRSVLYHDPKGVGGLTPLISDADRCGLGTLHLFQQIPSFARATSVSDALGHVTFYLKHFPVFNADGTTSPRYQLGTDTLPGYRLPLKPQDRVFFPNRREVMGFWLTKRAVWMAEGFLWLGIAAITTAVYQIARVVGSSNFADSAKPMIAKMVLTLCITIGGLMWTSIQREVQMFEPWRQLSDGRSQALYAGLKRSDGLSLGALGCLIMSTLRGAMIMLWASFAVIMVQVATIFVPPLMELAYAAGVTGGVAEYHEVAVLSGQTGLGLVITALAIHVVIFCNLLFLIFSGRTRPFLPRAPTTIASQIMYLCRSDRLLADLSDTSMISNEKLAKRLKKTNRLCRFGWFLRYGVVWYLGVEEYHEEQRWEQFYFDGITQSRTCT